MAPAGGRIRTDTGASGGPAAESPVVLGRRHAAAYLPTTSSAMASAFCCSWSSGEADLLPAARKLMPFTARAFGAPLPLRLLRHLCKGEHCSGELRTPRSCAAGMAEALGLLADSVRGEGEVHPLPPFPRSRGGASRRAPLEWGRPPRSTVLAPLGTGRPPVRDPPGGAPMLWPLGRICARGRPGGALML